MCWSLSRRSHHSSNSTLPALLIMLVPVWTFSSQSRAANDGNGNLFDSYIIISVFLSTASSRYFVYVHIIYNVETKKAQALDIFEWVIICHVISSSFIIMSCLCCENSNSDSLAQHVTGATHRADVLVVNCVLVRSSLVYQLSLVSTLNITQVNLQVPQVHTTECRFQRCLRQFDLDLFLEDLEHSSLICDSTDDDDDVNVNDLFDTCDNTLHSLFDIHAPTSIVCVRASQFAHWFDVDCCEVKS